ncbi:hypothetical protein GCM10027570_43150 [Streptomonospora sediminis]
MAGLARPTMPDRPWTRAPLVALDLAGTGAQDRGAEEILEAAAAPGACGKARPTVEIRAFLRDHRCAGWP